MEERILSLMKRVSKIVEDLRGDFPTGSGSQPCAMLEICEYQSHP